jgi:hypothetical protein
MACSLVPTLPLSLVGPADAVKKKAKDLIAFPFLVTRTSLQFVAYCFYLPLSLGAQL